MPKASERANPPTDPNAHIPFINNKRSGLRARSQILKALGDRALSAKELIEETGATYSALTYHLKLLEKAHVVRRGVKVKRATLWRQTGLGQQSIVE